MILFRRRFTINGVRPARPPNTNDSSHTAPQAASKLSWRATNELLRFVCPGAESGRVHTLRAGLTESAVAMIFRRRRGSNNDLATAVKLTMAERQEPPTWTAARQQPDVELSKPGTGHVSNVFRGKWTDADYHSGLGKEEVPDICIKRQPMCVYVGDFYDDAATADASSDTSSVLPCPSGSTSTVSTCCSASTESALAVCGQAASSRSIPLLRELHHARQLVVIAANRLDENTDGIGGGGSDSNNAARISKIYHGLTPKLCIASRDLGRLVR